MFDLGKLINVETPKIPNNESDTPKKADKADEADEADQAGATEPETLVPFEAICDAYRDDDMDSFLGNTYRRILLWSNRETRTLSFVRHNLKTLLSGIPFDGGGFRLTPEQRLKIAIEGNAFGVDYTVKTKTTLTDKFLEPDVAFGYSDAAPLPVSLTRPAGVAPRLVISNGTPGSGKTASVLLGALLDIVSDDAWEEKQAAWKRQNDTGRPYGQSGLIETPSTSGRALARVVCVFVPASLLAQWVEHTERLQPVLKEFTGKEFLIWEGKKAFQRRTTTQEGIPKTLEEAHALSQRQSKALVWILTAESSATNITTRSSPNLAYVARIYDEVLSTCVTEPRTAAPESEVIKTFIVNATIEMLSTGTATQPTHPIRREIGGDSLSNVSPLHMAVLHQCALPHWLRHLVATGMRGLMPLGIERMSFRINVDTIAARVNGSSGMAITNVDDLLTNMLVKLDLRADLPAEVFSGLQAEVRNMLVRTGENRQVSIPALLKDAGIRAQAKLDGMDAPVTDPVAKNAMSEAARKADARLVKTRRGYTGMVRLLTQLHEAVVPNAERECPITAMPVVEEDVIVMPCCLGWLSKQALSMCRNDCCCFCRAPGLGNALGMGTIQTIFQPLIDQPPADDAPIAVEHQVVEGDDDSLRKALRSLNKSKFNAGPEAAIKLISNLLKWKPKGLRLLLSFHYCTGSGYQTNRVRELLMQECDGLDSVRQICTHNFDNGAINKVTDEYQRDDDTNRVLIINTDIGSSSLAGLNLGKTHAVIFDRAQIRTDSLRHVLTDAQITQAIARAFRPSRPKSGTPDPYFDNTDNAHGDVGTKRPRDGATTTNSNRIFEPPKSTIPAKLVLFLDKL